MGVVRCLELSVLALTQLLVAVYQPLLGLGVSALRASGRVLRLPTLSEPLGVGSAVCLVNDPTGNSDMGPGTSTGDQVRRL